MPRRRPPVIGWTYRAHTVWALDEAVAVALLEQLATSAADCTQPWTPSTVEGNEPSPELAVIPTPSITSRGHGTAAYAEATTSSDNRRQVVTILSRCGGAVSRLVLSATQEAETAVADDLADALAGRAYDRLVSVVEWANATCPTP
jgi:hypothetical protein